MKSPICLLSFFFNSKFHEFSLWTILSTYIRMYFFCSAHFTNFPCRAKVIFALLHIIGILCHEISYIFLPISRKFREFIDLLSFFVSSQFHDFSCFYFYFCNLLIFKILSEFILNIERDCVVFPPCMHIWIQLIIASFQ